MSQHTLEDGFRCSCHHHVYPVCFLTCRVLAALAQMQLFEMKPLQHFCHTAGDTDSALPTGKQSIWSFDTNTVLSNSGWQLQVGVCFVAGEGTIQINQSLAHQSRPASTLVQQSFASAFKRDRSVGPKRTGKPMASTP